MKCLYKHCALIGGFSFLLAWPSRREGMGLIKAKLLWMICTVKAD